MKEITFIRGVSKERATKIKKYLIQSQKFLTLSGLEAEGHVVCGFDPGYLISRPTYSGGTYEIPEDVMDQLVYALEYGK